MPIFIGLNCLCMKIAPRIIFIFLFLVSFHQSLFAQYRESADVINVTFDLQYYNGDKITKGSIDIKRADTIFKTVTIDASSKVKFELPLQSNYEIVFQSPKYVTMFLTLDARIPGEDLNGRHSIAYQSVVNFFTSKDYSSYSNFSFIKNFEDFPFQKVSWNAKHGEFTDDKEWKKNFDKGPLPPDPAIEAKKKKEREEAEKAAREKAEQDKLNSEKTARDKERKSKERFALLKILNPDRSGLPITEAKVTLIDENGKEVFTDFTNSYGKINLKNFYADKKYKLKVQVKEKSPCKITNRYGKGIQVKKELAVEHVFDLIIDDNFLNIAETEKSNGNFAGSIIIGEGATDALSNAKINLVDSKNNVIKSAQTNALGSFVFANIDPDESYIISIDEPDPKITAGKKISIVTKDGKTVKSTTAAPDGKFKFELLASDKTATSMLEVDEAELKIKLKGKIFNTSDTKDPVKNSKVFLLDENGKQLQQAITDNKGIFAFLNLPPDLAYAINLDENDPKIKSYTKLYLADEYGNIIRELTKDKLNKFSYQLLQSDIAKLSEIYVDDPWLKVIEGNDETASIISENVLFNAGDASITPEAQAVLEKVIKVLKAKNTIKVEIGSHTDSNGSDAFNMNLSKQRAQSAFNYMVKRGIEKTRLTSVGYGETKLKNRCVNGVECSEAEHAQNRRVEFKILNK